MAAAPYIPRADARFLAWATQFVSNITANPWSYGVSPADAEALQRALDEFTEAMARASNESTRTKSAIATKNDARAGLENFCRRYAALIRANSGITSQALLDAGIRPPNGSHARRSAPATSPLVNVVGAGNSVHEIHFADSMAPDRKAKPFGAVCLQLFCDITDGETPGSLEDAKYMGSMTRNRFLVVHEQKDARRTATYWGRWQSQRGDFGPWSNPVSFTIAFGGTKGKSAERHKADAADQSVPMRLAA